MSKILFGIALLFSLPLGAISFGPERAVSTPVLVTEDTERWHVDRIESIAEGTRLATVWSRSTKYSPSEVYLRVIDTATSDEIKPRIFVGHGENPMVASNGRELIVVYYDLKSIAVRRFDLDGTPLGKSSALATAPSLNSSLVRRSSRVFSISYRPGSVGDVDNPWDDSWVVVWSEPFTPDGGWKIVDRIRRMRASTAGKPASAVDTLISGVALLAVTQSPDSTIAVWNGDDSRTYAGIWRGGLFERTTVLPFSALRASAAWNGSSFGIALADAGTVRLFDFREGGQTALVHEMTSPVSKLDLRWIGFEYALASQRGIPGPDAVIRMDHLTGDGQATRLPEVRSLDPLTKAASAVQVENALVVTEAKNDVVATILRGSETEDRLLSWQGAPQRPRAIFGGGGQRTIVWEEPGTIYGRIGEGAAIRLADGSRGFSEVTASSGHVYVAWASQETSGGYRLHLTDWDQANGTVRSVDVATPFVPEIESIVSDGTVIVVSVRLYNELVLYRASTDAFALERWYSDPRSGIRLQTALSDCCMWLVSDINSGLDAVVIDKQTGQVIGRKQITGSIRSFAIATEGDELRIVRAYNEIESLRIDRAGNITESRILVAHGTIDRLGFRIAGTPQDRSVIWAEYPVRFAGYYGVPPEDARLEIFSVSLQEPDILQKTVFENLPYLEEFSMMFDDMGRSIVYARRIPELGFAPRVFYRVEPERSRAARR